MNVFTILNRVYYIDDYFMKKKGYETLEEATQEKFDKITKLLSNADLSIFEEIRKSRGNKNLKNQ